MRLKGSSLSLIAVMIFMLVFVIMSLRMEFLSSKLLPLIIASIVFVLAAIGLIKELVPAKARSAIRKRGCDEAVDGDEAGVSDNAKSGIRVYLPMTGWLVGSTLAIYLVGFHVTIPLFIIAYMKSRGAKWLLSVITALLTEAFTYGVFEFALRIELYRGIISGWLGF